MTAVKPEWELKTDAILKRIEVRQKHAKYFELVSDREAVKAFVTERLSDPGLDAPMADILRVQDEWMDYCRERAGLCQQS